MAIETDIRFPRGRISSNGETDRFLEDWNCAWSNGYPFAKDPNHPRGKGYVPGSQLALYTDCRFPKSITQFGEP